MRLPAPVLKHIVSVTVLLVLCSAAWSPAAAGDISGLNFAQMRSLAEIKAALQLLETGLAGVEGKNQGAFDLQKAVAAKSGECITRLVELSQKADLPQDARREEYKSLFLKNGDLLRRMLAYNQTRIDDALEEKQGGAQDKNSFFASPEWRQAQYLTSLANYWLGWNGYYGALLHAGHGPARTGLLEEAISGFTLAVINFQEPSIVNRSILGRALCFKEIEQYGKALQDLQSLMTKVSRDDPLYAQAGYEKAVISYQSGKKDLALQQIQELQQAVKPGAMPPQVKEKIKSLQTGIALGIAEKKQEGRGGTPTKESLREAVQELKRIACADPSQAGVLYRYVLEHAEALAGVPDSELGGIGAMAVADWYFDRKQYAPAAERYRRLYNAPDALIKPHIDDVCFRLAYCLSQQQQWQDAVSCLETLFAKYPASSFEGKAACLYYVTAVHAYKANPSEATYGRYIRAAECYVRNCPDAQDKSEAHYQLGHYYQQKNRMQEALREFALVKSDSPHYVEAQKAALLSSIDKLQTAVEKIETLVRQGESDEAAKLYRETLKQAQGWQKTGMKQSAAADTSEPAAHMAFLMARLYLHGPDPEPRKALPLLQGFEARYPVTRQRELLYGMVKKLRLESCLNLYMLKEAEQELNSIAEKKPVDEDTFAFLNQCAEKQYQQARDAQTHGNSALAQKEAPMALAVYGKLSEIALRDIAYNKFHEPLQLRMAELYSATGQTARARTIYEQKLLRDPTSGDTLYRLGYIYEREGNWNAALDVWSKCTRGLPPGSHRWFEARYRTAQAFVKLGNTKDACEMLSITRKLHPEISNDELSEDYTQLQNAACQK